VSNRFLLVFGVLLVAHGCAAPDAERAPPAQAADSVQPQAAIAQWSREALEVQPRMDALRSAIPADLGYTPGTTQWVAVDSTSLIGIDTVTADTPGALLSALAMSLGWADVLGDAAWEQTTRVWMQDDVQAVGVVLQWGFQDDSVAGRDFRVHMRLDGVWRAHTVEQRFHCARRVTDGECA